MLRLLYLVRTPFQKILHIGIHQNCLADILVLLQRSVIICRQQLKLVLCQLLGIFQQIIRRDHRADRKHKRRDQYNARQKKYLHPLCKRPVMYQSLHYIIASFFFSSQRPASRLSPAFTLLQIKDFINPLLHLLSYP